MVRQDKLGTVYVLVEKIWLVNLKKERGTQKAIIICGVLICDRQMKEKKNKEAESTED